MIIDTIKVLKADNGKVVTDGQIYGKTVILPDNRSETEFHEISESEYNEIVKEQTDGTEIS